MIKQFFFTIIFHFLEKIDLLLKKSFHTFNETCLLFRSSSSRSILFPTRPITNSDPRSLINSSTQLFAAKKLSLLILLYVSLLKTLHRKLYHIQPKQLLILYNTLKLMPWIFLDRQCPKYQTSPIEFLFRFFLSTKKPLFALLTYFWYFYPLYYSDFHQIHC